MSVTSLSCLLCGMRLRTPTDLRRGRALSAEIDNDRWFKRLKYTIPIIKPATAARRLLRLASKNHFTLFEHYITDHLGHGRNVKEIKTRLMVLDEFILSVFHSLPNDVTLLVCSDHGNLEDKKRARSWI